jgi:hypothetical protein
VKRLVLRIVIVALAVTGSTVLAQQAAGPSLAAPALPEAFSGFWDYNHELSVDAATGRPEQAPRSAAQRSLGNAAAAAPPAPPRSGGGGGGRSGGTASGGQGGGDVQPRSEFDEARRAMAAIIAAERRTLVRDLLEVPEKLTITSEGSDVTFIDDLKRARTYVADGKTRKYQLAAARFDARTGWDGKYFRKDIAGPNNFKMSETYFLSEDGQRLFVITRIGDPRRPETMAGVNRVYDRIGRPGAPGA